VTSGIATETKVTQWWSPLFLGVLVTVTAAWALHQYNQSALAAQTAKLTVEADSYVRQRFSRYAYGLRGVRDAIVTAGVESVNRREFVAYSQTFELQDELPGAPGLGFIRQVPVAQEARSLARARADSAPDFAIRALAPHRGDRFVIRYIYPTAGNETATGLDIASEAKLRAAALAAAREGQPQLTEPITLAQAVGKRRRGFLILLPIYGMGLTTRTPEERERAVMGWSYAPLLVDDVLSDLNPSTSQITLQLTRSGETEPFDTSSTGTPSTAGAVAVKREFGVLGQSWTLEAWPTLTMRDSLGLWSYWWAIWLGTGLTGVGLWAGHIRRFSRNRETYSSDIELADYGRLGTFLRSSWVARSWLTMAVALRLVFATGSFQVWRSSRQDVRTRLLEGNSKAVAHITRKEKGYRRDVLFLASTTPVRGLIRILRTGTNAHTWGTQGH